MRVTARGLHHAFPGRAPLYGGLDLDFAGGDLCALTGPSGSGKTTLLSILARWLRPSEGEVTHDGIERTSWVAQSPHGVTARTALDHVALPFLARGRTRAQANEEAQDLLAKFRLDGVADRAFRYLSGGEGQRLMLATAIASAPQLMLVDEPTAGLDPVSAATVIDTLGALAGGDRIVIVSTHDPRVRDACHRAIDVATTTTEAPA